MFRKKKRGLNPIMDGVKEIQLYICPSCGRKVEKKSLAKCEVCGISVCEERFSFSKPCGRVIELDYREHEFSHYNLYFCRNHYNMMEKQIKSSIKERRINTKPTKTPDNPS